MSFIEDMMQKMMRRFDDTNENIKEMLNDLYGIGQKVEAHELSINHLKEQMKELSTTVNTCLPVTHLRNIIQNPKDNWHYMVGTTHGGKKTMDLPMPSKVEVDTGINDDVVEKGRVLHDVLVKKLSDSSFYPISLFFIMRLTLRFPLLMGDHSLPWVMLLLIWRKDR